MPALVAGLLSIPHLVVAVEQTIPTPPPGGFVDTESSIYFAVTNWPGLGRSVTVDLTAHVTPSNCVQVDFGRDLNSDGNLTPGETMLCIGVDCGVPFARSESKFRVEVEQWNLSTYSAGQPEQEVNHHCSPSTSSSPHPSTFTFSFKQPSAVSNRITHAKVTTRGHGDSAAQITAEIKRKGIALILR